MKYGKSRIRKMTELKDRVASIIAEWNPLKSEYALPNSTVGITDLWTIAYDMELLIKDQQSRINELEFAIEQHLRYPLMGSKELKEVVGK
jgi:hypothetical protein